MRKLSFSLQELFCWWTLLCIAVAASLLIFGTTGVTLGILIWFIGTICALKLFGATKSLIYSTSCGVLLSMLLSARTTIEMNLPLKSNSSGDVLMMAIVIGSF